MDSTFAPVTPALTPGSAACQCAACGEFFRSVSGFDKHRHGTVDERRCWSPAKMRTLGMTKNEKGFWITAVFNRPDLTA